MKLDGVWPIRVVWLLQPVALAPVLGSTLDLRSAAVAAVIEAIAWLGWTVGVVAVLVPRTVGLTALRLVAPASLGLAVWASTDQTSTTAGAVAVTAATIAVVAALAPTTGDAFVNGSAYGAERRFALRPPAALLFGPIQLLWALIAASAVTGPLLLAAGQVFAGIAASAIGVAVIVVGCRSLHQLSRRWLVMVPAGVVIHDPTVVNPQLFRRSTIATMGPAPEDTGAYDLTGGALGLALEVQLTETVTLELPARKGTKSSMIHATAVMFTPSRPGAVLREAAERRLPVA